MDDRSERNCRKKQRRGILKNNENGVAWKSGKSGGERRLRNDPRGGEGEKNPGKMEGRRWGRWGALLDETGGSLLHPPPPYFLSSCERY